MKIYRVHFVSKQFSPVNRTRNKGQTIFTKSLFRESCSSSNSFHDDRSTFYSSHRKTQALRWIFRNESKLGFEKERQQQNEEGATKRRRSFASNISNAHFSVETQSTVEEAFPRGLFRDR